MTRKLDNTSLTDRKRSFAYHRDFWPGMVGYVVVLTAVILWGGVDDRANPLRFVWAVLPVLPALLVVRAVVRHLHRIDDYQRLLLLQGLAFGFGLAMIGSITIGFLGMAGLVVPAAGWVIYGIGMLGWAVAGVVRR